MLASTVRVDAGIEGDVGAAVPADDRLGQVTKELSSRRGIFLRVPILIALQTDFLEAVGRVPSRAASAR